MLSCDITIYNGSVVYKDSHENQWTSTCSQYTNLNTRALYYRSIPHNEDNLCNQTRHCMPKAFYIVHMHVHTWQKQQHKFRCPMRTYLNHLV